MPMHNLFMQRCFDLAYTGAPFVSSKYGLGALIVHQDKVIEEGIDPVVVINKASAIINQHDTYLLKKSYLYLLMEPRLQAGHSPSLVALIVKQAFAKVIICDLDPDPAFRGQGVQALQEAGIEVITGILKEQGKVLFGKLQNTRLTSRPQVIIKFAQSADGYIGKPGQQVWISHPWLKRLTHKWRSEVDAILVGTGTAEVDNPKLDNRKYVGSSPTRIVLDRQGRLSPTLHLFDGQHPTLIIRDPSATAPVPQHAEVLYIDYDNGLLHALLHQLHNRGIHRLLVEGGAQVINSFLREGLWNEARIYTSTLRLGEGIAAPKLAASPSAGFKIGDTHLYQYFNQQ